MRGAERDAHIQGESYMNMAPVDWSIVIAVLGVMMVGVFLSRQHMKSVADFLAAGRTAGRYAISIATGIAGLGAITIVGLLEMNYVAGFSMTLVASTP